MSILVGKKATFTNVFFLSLRSIVLNWWDVTQKRGHRSVLIGSGGEKKMLKIQIKGN